MQIGRTIWLDHGGHHWAHWSRWVLIWLLSSFYLTKSELYRFHPRTQIEIAVF